MVRLRLAGVYQRILLPTDGSDASEGAIEEAVGLAVRLGAELRVLSVVDASGMESPGPSGRAADGLEEDAERAAASAADRARAAGVERVETVVEHGAPAERIVEVADDLGADLIVMGTHGRSGLDRHLLGSVAEKTLRTADVPVLTVPDPSPDE